MTPTQPTSSAAATLEAVMQQAEIDLAAAHAEICKLQGLDPATHSWPEWSSPANTLRWFKAIRAGSASEAMVEALIDARDCMSRVADIIESERLFVEAGRLRRSADYCRAVLLRAAKQNRSALSPRDGVPGMVLDRWLPIATAPKDGTEVILFGLYPENDTGHPTLRVTAGFWCEPDPPVIGDCGGECRCPEYGEPEDPLWCCIHGGSDSGWMSTDGGFTTEWPATHWQPLPAAPLSTASSSGRETP